MTTSALPDEFTRTIESLFQEGAFVEARQLLLERLSSPFKGIHTLLALTYFYQPSRTPADSALASSWFDKAIALGDTDAMVFLGRALLSGELGLHDPECGLELLLQAADQGDAFSAYHAAVAFDLGEQTKQNLPKAFEYFNKAAQGGVPQAMHNLGAYYQHGKCVPRNPSLAVAYFEEAARNGSPLSCLALAVLHLEGQLLEKNAGMALAWLNIYQALFPQAEAPIELQDLLAEASVDETQFARQAAEQFLRTQLKTTVPRV